jgi:hypothetical protein
MRRKSANLLSAAVLLAATSLTAPFVANADPALDAKTSAELQKVLGAQVNAVATHLKDHKLPFAATSTFTRLLLWHQIALETTAIDHTPGPAFGEQVGPTRASRAMAIIHIAMFEAVNAYYQTYQSYAGVAPVSGDVSVDFAIDQAAYNTLIALYPEQTSRLQALYDLDIVSISGDAAGLAAGQALGAASAAAILALRANDGSNFTEPTYGVNYNPPAGPGLWSPDPISPMGNVALGAYWGQVTPFVIPTGSTFRPGPPPALSSGQYAIAFNAVKNIGGDPSMGTPTHRTTAETLDGIFWTYDAAPALCAPPRLYNQVATTLAVKANITKVQDMARYLALINTGLADAAIAAWDTKYFYNEWRPVTGIRNASTATNPETKPDPNWYPLGAQATNSHGPNFTPPFPAYPSGHGTFGGTLFQIERHFLPDSTKFTFVSDEYNGQNVNDLGVTQPYHPLTFSSLTQAEYENSESRVYIGVHWQYDADIAVNMGNQIGDYVFANSFQPATPGDRQPTVQRLGKVPAKAVKQAAK